MNLGDSFDSIKAIKFEGSSIKILRKVAVAGKVFLLDFKPCWPRTTIIHVICSVVSRSNVDAAWRILGIAIWHMEFCFLLISRILGIRINSLFLKSFLDNFTFDEALGPSEVS